MQDATMDAPQSDLASDAYLRQLKTTFEQLPNDIDLYLFTAKGHEFRYSTVLEYHGKSEDLVLRMDRGTGFLDGHDGLTSGNVLALYTHLHAEGTPQWALYFTRKCAEYHRKRCAAT